MEFTVSDNHIVITVPIVLRKYVNTLFDKTKNGVLTITDNNHLILKTAWRYHDMHERLGNADAIATQEKISPMTVYRYLNLTISKSNKN